jgi:septal ring factor EnvC (AmiA/AmiB activator)
VRVFHNKKLFSCYTAFEDLKRYSYGVCLNEIKAKQIYHMLYASYETFLKYYARKSELGKYKCFYKWKNESQISREIEKIKNEIEASAEKKASVEISNLEAKITEKEKESSSLKSNLSKYLQIEADFVKKIKQYEDSENEYLARIKRLEDEKRQLEECLKNMTTSGSNCGDSQKVFENKVDELLI